MSIPITFYINNKRENSTKLPSGESITYSCDLKENCSVISPRITLSAENPTNYNYAYISRFNRYYFVTDWVYTRGIWSASLQVDVLASYRAAIRASSQYVLRSASESDGNIVDTVYPAKSGAELNGSVSGYLPGFPALPGDGAATGTFIVGIVAPMPWLSNAVNPYGLQYIALTPENFTEMMNQLLNNSGTSYGNWLTDTVKATFNPFQYIVSVKWFPISVPKNNLVEAQNTLKLGWYSFTGVSYYIPVSSNYYTVTLDALPDHPQISRGAYLNKAPYREIYCYLPGAGTITLDSDLYSAPTVRLDLDFLTGLARYYIYCNSIQIASVDCEIGVQVPIAQITVNPGKTMLDAIGSIAGIAGSAAAGNVAGIISGAASGIGNALDNIAPQAQARGQQGARGLYMLNPLIQMWEIVRRVVDSDKDDLGAPLCAKRTLSTLSGYCKIADADIALPSTSQEQLQVKNYMEGGVCLE